MTEKTESTASKYFMLLVYAILFYGIWILWEFYFSPLISRSIQNEYICQLVKSGVIKNLVWTLPAVLLINHFKTDVYVNLKDMFANKVKPLKFLPVFIIFTAYLLIGAVFEKGGLHISSEFGLCEISVVLFVGITEEMVFRGWLLNMTVNENKKIMPVIVNSFMFLLIHFPIWIYEGIFVQNFQNFGFLCIIILSCIFSWTFIKSKNILVPILLHMYWDLLMFMFY